MKKRVASTYNLQTSNFLTNIHCHIGNVFSSTPLRTALTISLEYISSKSIRLTANAGEMLFLVAVSREDSKRGKKRAELFESTDHELCGPCLQLCGTAHSRAQQTFLDSLAYFRSTLARGDLCKVRLHNGNI